jgi:hypothetical protein
MEAPRCIVCNTRHWSCLPMPSNPLRQGCSKGASTSPGMSLEEAPARRQRDLWRPTKLITIRFGSAPSSRNRVDDHRVRVRPWAVAIARPAIRSRHGDRGCGCVGRGGSPDICRRSRGVGGRSPDVRRTNSSAPNGSSSNGSPRCRAAVRAPMYSPANPSNARCRKRPSDSGLGGVQREFYR